MLNLNPEFCVIAPTAYLERYATQSNTHLVLAHLVDSDEQYANFYKQISELPNQQLIMDNGCFEQGEPYQPDRLVELGNKCGADVIVLPDYPFQPSHTTIESAMVYAPQFKDAGFKSLIVPQSERGDLEDWISCYIWAVENSDMIDAIGMSILGIPAALPHIPKMYARVVMTQLLIDHQIFDFNIYHHYLGLNAAPNVEIPSLILMDALDSCDSSNPVWSGINSWKYNTMQDSFAPLSKKYLPPVDFNKPYLSEEIFHDIIQHNLDITFDIFKNPAKYI